MLRNIKQYIKKAIALEELQHNKPKPKPKNNVKAIKEKMRRLNVMYMAGGKTDEEYVAETKALNAQLNRAEKEQENDVSRPNIDQLKELLNMV